MRLYVTLFSVLFAGTLYGQATLTGANHNPQAGDAFISFGGAASLSPGDSGINVTWDFSTFTSTSNDTSIYAVCSSTPECDYFSGSNLAVGSSESDGYTYLSATNSTLSYVGYYTSNDTAQYTSYTVMEYPFTYNSSFTTGFLNHFQSISNQYQNYQSGIMTTICDGYGTLITPAGIYQNILRAHTTWYHTDSSIETSTGSITLSHDTEIEYKWYMPGFHSILFNLYFYNSGAYSDAGYYIQIPASIAAVNNLHHTFSIFPNPAKDILTIKFSFTEMRPISITILDMLGRQVAVVGNDKYEAGEHQLSYSTASLPKGLYLIQLKSGADNITKKLEVQ